MATRTPAGGHWVAFDCHCIVWQLIRSSSGTVNTVDSRRVVRERERGARGSEGSFLGPTGRCSCYLLNFSQRQGVQLDRCIWIIFCGVFLTTELCAYQQMCASATAKNCIDTEGRDLYIAFYIAVYIALCITLYNLKFLLLTLF